MATAAQHLMPRTFVLEVDVAAFEAARLSALAIVRRPSSPGCPPEALLCDIEGWRQWFQATGAPLLNEPHQSVGLPRTIGSKSDELREPSEWAPDFIPYPRFAGHGEKPMGKR